MPQKTLFEETRLVGEKIVTALTKDQSRNKKDRHLEYKKKRITEATEMWDEFNKRLRQLKDSMNGIHDPCVADLEEKYKSIYKRYTDRLFAIGANDNDDDDDDGDREEGKDSSNNEYSFAIQEKRFQQLKRILNEIEFKIDHNETPSPAYATVKSQKISNLWEKIEAEDDNVNSSTPAFKQYKKEFSECETLMDQCLIFLCEHMGTVNKSSSNNGLKLDRVKIQTFGGDYFKWISFKDLFESMVIKNKNLSNAERMQHLKTHLTNEAETLLSDLMVSEANFQCAWDRLLNRYHNERVLVHHMLTKLMNQATGRGDSSSIKTILDTTDQILLALKNIGRPTEHWDDWIVIIVVQKLHPDTQKDWENSIKKSRVLPKWDELKSFLEDQFRLLENLENNKKNDSKNKSRLPLKAYQVSIATKCVICDENHTLYNCAKWKSMQPKDRLVIVKKQKWCKRCLRDHEDKQNCEKSCKKCQKAHSTWLHENREKRVEQSNTMSINHFGMKNQILLATVVIKTYDIFGQPVFLRAIVDSGAEGSLITTRAAALINPKPMVSDRSVQGLGNARSNPLKKIHLRIEPRFQSEFFIDIDIYILKNLTKALPEEDIEIKSWKHIKNLVWADPHFYKQGQIDALLGMDVIAEIMQPGLVKGLAGQPMAQATRLGWIMSGNIKPNDSNKDLHCFVTQINEVQMDLAKFWEFEEINPERAMTPDEIICENLYATTMGKHNNGQFIVTIPFKQEGEGPERLGESKGQAVARFLQVEKRLVRDRNLGSEYKKVMNEYIELGHMRDVTALPQIDKKYYILHHAVVKLRSLTTKVRVVFDASAKTTTGWSLNDCMYTGAKQQRDLTDILINWRVYRYAYKADIEKMYRMIQLNKKDQQYHTILWRNSPNEQLKEYQLTTTTFGTAAAPFLATRTLVQIASEQQNTHPLASETLKHNFYMDDLIGGNHSIDAAIQCKNGLFSVLEPRHFNLRKWASNCPTLLATLPPEMTEKALQTFEDNDNSKALGLSWNSLTDQFSFQINWLAPDQSSWTKRQFLAESSKLFDPLGWLAPITINAKIMMQDVWLSKVAWDETLPDEIATKWAQFRKEFKTLENIKIDRWIDFQPDCELSLHGFCDASEKAYAAVIYARIKAKERVTTHLLTSKTRVSPVKAKLTLPRLELCGAVLLSNLIQVVNRSLKLGKVPIFAWTDSMITLGWIKRDPNDWKTFIANRVAEIGSHKDFHWNYVPTDQNPADCASRGLMPNEMINHSLWWKGPNWLRENPSEWPSAIVPEHNLEQRNKILVNFASLSTNDLIPRYSSWDKLKRVTAYVRRFKTKQTGALAVAELKSAELTLIKICQVECFPREIQDLNKGLAIHKNSQLKSLNVTLDTVSFIIPRMVYNMCTNEIKVSVLLYFKYYSN